MKKILISILLIISSLCVFALSPADSTVLKKYPDNFNKLMETVLIFEGKYFAEEKTNFGIMQTTYDTYRTKNHLKKRDVLKITDGEVYDIYYTMYYLPAKCDLLTPAVAFVHFDASINFGVGGAYKLIKRTLGLSYKYATWDDDILWLLDDSIDKEVALEYIDVRKEKRYEIVANNKAKKKFLKGWLNRDNQLKEIIEEYY